ncbi:GcrA family cell cycle regulator [Sphingomonas sp. 3-13AW]|uniref:GcrA family cell cycle regulator n=1 Tax=Sphingomonas sp. 3-13AW TaxID=3050450 RepID=UPI003BB675A3
MDFESFETEIAAGRISDLPTIAAWMRHRLLEGERTRRRRATTRVAWTSEQLANVERMWRDGRTGGQIAKELGVTRNAVMGRIHRMGLLGQGGIPKEVARDNEMRRELQSEFEAAYGRAPVCGRRGDAAMLVCLAAVRAGRSPNVVARWSGVPVHEVMEILSNYHDKGIWLSDDPPPNRWSGDGRLLSMMLDAEVAHGIFRMQRLS